MEFPVLLQPSDTVRRDHGMGGKIPVKTITANRRKEYESYKIFVRLAMQEEIKSLINHQHGANSNKKITVNEKITKPFPHRAKLGT